MISIIVFIAIELMPGSYVEMVIGQGAAVFGAQLELTEGEIKLLELRYGFNKPIYVKYWKWFSHFIRGDLGRSWSHNHQPVKDLIIGRLGLTALISLCTTIFINLVSWPIGVYSAVKQYSIGDTIFTFSSFIGLSIPNFLLALIFIVIGFFAFGQVPGGLFSPDYVTAPWSIFKFFDLLSHLWIPVVVLGTAGTAGSVRMLRALMLDELNRPYVDTARSKGLKERVVIWKYPLRIAANPAITGIAGLLPGLLSGEIIVSIVLNIPTTGPLFYDGIMNHDANLAGGSIMLLSILTVVGNLVADLLLAWVDPRIHYD